MSDSLEIMRDALEEAINDEYRARASYAAAIEKFGPASPFPAIREAESRHVNALIPLFDKYRLPVPADTWAGRIDVPDTLGEMCQLGVEAEINNHAMYQRLIGTVSDPQAQRVFANLGDASLDNHLTAFQACATGAATPAASTGRMAGRAARSAPMPPASILGGAVGAAPLASRLSLPLGLAAGALLVFAWTQYRKRRK